MFLGSGAETLVRWGRAEHFVPAVRRLVPTIQFQRNHNRSDHHLDVGIQGFPDEVLWTVEAVCPEQSKKNTARGT